MPTRKHAICKKKSEFESKFPTNDNSDIPRVQKHLVPIGKADKTAGMGLCIQTDLVKD